MCKIKILKYGFCKELLFYEWTSEQLNVFFIKIRLGTSVNLILMKKLCFVQLQSQKKWCLTVTPIGSREFWYISLLPHKFYGNFWYKTEILLSLNWHKLALVYNWRKPKSASFFLAETYHIHKSRCISGIE